MEGKYGGLIDNFLLEYSSQVLKLEDEIEKSIEGLPNICRIDTTNLEIEEVALKIKKYITENKII